MKRTNDLSQALSFALLFFLSCCSIPSPEERPSRATLEQRELLELLAGAFASADDLPISALER